MAQGSDKRRLRSPLSECGEGGEGEARARKEKIGWEQKGGRKEGKREEGGW